MTDSLVDRMLVVLHDDSLDDENIDESKAEMLESMIEGLDWDECNSAIENLLSMSLRTIDYESVAALIWALDDKPFNKNKIIALLYHRLDPDFNSEHNLVWSITSRFKNEGYLSEYIPSEDAEVMNEFNLL